MLEVHFDTMAVVHRMVDAGFEPKQAEVMTVILRDAISSGVATKADVAELHGEIKSVRAEIKNVRTELKGEIDKLRADVTGEIEIVRGEIDKLRAEMTGKLESMQTNIRWIMVIGGFIAVAVAEPLVTRLFSWLS